MRKPFKTGLWNDSIDVSNFIQNNFTPYLGDESFLTGKSSKTEVLWTQAKALIEEEIEKGIIDIETSVYSGIDNFEPGYLNKENETKIGRAHV